MPPSIRASSIFFLLGGLFLLAVVLWIYSVGVAAAIGVLTNFILGGASKAFNSSVSFVGKITGGVAGTVLPEFLAVAVGYLFEQAAAVFAGGFVALQAQSFLREKIPRSIVPVHRVDWVTSFITLVPAIFIGAHISLAAALGIVFQGGVWTYLPVSFKKSVRSLLENVPGIGWLVGLYDQWHKPPTE
jgi:hypothetical protein